LGNLKQLTDAAGNVTQMDYDTLGRKTGMSDPDMGNWQYRYDAAGNLTRQRDANNQATCFYYDALNRMLGKTYHSGVSDLDALSCAGTYAASYSYDGLLRFDAFDGSALPSGWSSGGSVSVSGGQAHITGDGDGSWDDYVKRTGSVADGTAARFVFRLNSTSAAATLFLDSGTWGQADYRRWGLYIGGGTLYRDRYEGTVNNTAALMSLQANTWYEALLVLDSADQYRVAVWKHDDPVVRADLAEAHTNWGGTSWRFTSQVKTGVEDLDDRALSC
jgi:YD repeat-containing protein